MDTNFKTALNFVLLYEGGYSDHPHDPGGATNHGITHLELAHWRGRPVTRAEIRDLQVSEAESIYRRHYWDACRCPDLPSALDIAVFDCAVNQGSGRAARYLQLAAHAAPDGIIGPKTLGAVWRGAVIDILIEFNARRMNGYGNLARLFPTFGLGWSRRLMACHALALSELRVKDAGPETAQTETGI